MIKHVGFCCAFLLFSASVVSAQTRLDGFLPVSQGDSLELTVYVPAQAPPPAGYPALLFVHGFGLNKDWDTLNCATYARQGYVTLCYSVRGHGASSGLSTIMSTQERNDLRDMVSYLGQFPGVDSNAVGILGGSQGGLHGLWTAVDRLPVKAISTDVIVPGWASDLFMNGSVRTTLASLLRAFFVRYSPVRDTLWELLRSGDYDSLAAMFARDREVDTSALNSSNIPRITFLKWQDHYFGAADGIQSFLHQTAPGKLYMGTGGHFSDYSNGENYFQSDQITRWFGYWLRGLPTSILDELPVTYARSSLPQDSAGNFSWTHQAIPEWPPSAVTLTRLFLSPDMTLSSFPTASLDSFVVQNSYTDPTYTFDTGYLEGFRGSSFDRALPRSAVRFRSDPFMNEREWVGSPHMVLSVRSAYSLFPLHALIYEEDSLGQTYFINRITFTARHWEPGSRSIVDAGGIPHAHRFSVGSRLIVEFTNIDQPYRAAFNNVPFIIPLFQECSVTVFTGDAEPSFVEFPFIATPSAIKTPDNTRLDVTLFPNAPNPFNPGTIIRYQLSMDNYVSLSVYDLLGREVAVLVNEKKGPGSYEVRFDAPNLSSGVYFYRLTAGQHVRTRKMALIR